uniref:F-box domain-containing protein n=1 Tax=Globisporangium ultimum (strain ATCC 200006 / CBS 805.95 / DAOM BR144) TaxID=431595 RepID=K3WJM5_GLOUD
MGAELSKLSEPVLHRVYNFLQAPDFCRVTQANKVLNHMADNPSLWREFLRQDFPAVIESASVPSNEKTRYIAEYKEKARRKRVYEEMIQQDFAWLMQEDRLRRGGGVYPFRPGPPGLVLPPPPFRPIIPGMDSRRDRWGFGDSDLLPFDPRGSFLDM